jgi:Histidine kinase-like ATPase domain
MEVGGVATQTPNFEAHPGEHVVQFYEHEAAIELESLWNGLGRELSFSLFCAYPAASVMGSGHADALHRVCHLHSAVVDRSGERIREGVPLVGELAATFPAEPESAGRARRLLGDTLRLRGCERGVVDTAVLVLSELTSNAVRHAGSPFSVTLTITDATLRLAVEDAGALAADGAMPVRTTHGLGVVNTLALRWGVQRTPAGKAVWAELAV